MVVLGTYLATRIVSVPRYQVTAFEPDCTLKYRADKVLKREPGCRSSSIKPIVPRSRMNSVFKTAQGGFHGKRLLGSDVPDARLAAALPHGRRYRRSGSRRPGACGLRGR